MQPYAVGALIAVACVAVPTFGVGLFTSDVELQNMIRSIAPLMVGTPYTLDIQLTQLESSRFQPLSLPLDPS